ncbi:MAG: c-type cytochrome [Opitutaceae bacterium]|nr:c-type cytochrome [Opitutaceae bacterium]
MTIFSLLRSCALAAAVGSLLAAERPIEYPRLRDERLQISLYASDPDIVTPIASVVDAEGRLYVIECHTHSPPPNYPGPKGDRIKVFEGTRPDGRYARMSIFAEDIHQAQSLALDRDGTLYVVGTREVLVLHDRDRDGRSEARRRLLHLDPYEKRANPHGQMMGIAFSNDGWMYVGTGTTSDDWIASDGTRLPVGPYWGGIIARCRPDGTQLERVAWGFWNPFSIGFDRQGRLLCVDNDPDHRGPNRLLHIVHGGDYGYKRIYGRYGLHPYQAWEGELPGTLPMIHGIGEAPTAVIDASTAALPADYRDTILGATWGEHDVTLFRPKPAGASITATREIFLRGEGHDNQTSPFRPSGMSASPVDGAIYISDWMLIDYTTHQRGRIWKVTARDGVPTLAPRKPFSPEEPTAEFARMQRLTEAARIEEYASLRQALSEPDPFIRNAAVTALSRPVFRRAVLSDLEHADAKVRLGALLALRRADVSEPAPLIALRLGDPDLDVVQLAMIWAGEKELISLADRIDAVGGRANFNKALFQTWLATMQIMQNASAAAAGEKSAAGTAKGPGGGAKKGSDGGYYLNRQLSPEFFEKLVHDEQRPVLLRAMALRWLPSIERRANHELIATMARQSDPMLQIEAVRRLGGSSRAEAAAVLREIALNANQPASLRAEALAALAGKPDLGLVSLLDDREPAVRLEAARTLRALRTDPAVLAAAARKLATIEGDPREVRFRSQLQFLIAPEKISRPGTVEGWQQLLARGGNPEAGRRVFFSANVGCVACHVSEGRGVRLGAGQTAGFIAMALGPELSVIGRTANRDALIHSVVKPSDYIAPEYQGWFVKMKNGEMHTGREIDQAARSIQLIILDGHEHDFPRAEIASWGALEDSLMPPELPLALAIEEFRDLVAYLESLR